MMEVLKENPADVFASIGSSVESFQKLLASQKELFHTQIDLLQKIVVTQCKLTGVNPLSQEMAAGSLSIKIGKRPRDLLNPKAVKYMQSVFSIKDTISKKESREISALCGVTVTQVREFFAGQRSRVRKHVRLSKEKVVRSNASKASQDSCSTVSDPAMPIDQVPLNSVDSKTVEEFPSCSSQEEALPNIDNSDKNFLENIFNLMRKEETFSGQVKLMEWVLQIQNSSVLYWFLTKGGLMILTTWLGQAASEEQTTVLLVILKVLCHLPLHKALPVHMSAVLQTVNRLRFYRTSDISNRARVLLSRWSKLFVRSQNLKKPTSMKSPNAAQKDIIQKQRTGEIPCDESWQSKVDIPEILALTFEDSENSRNSEPPRTLKLLPASADDSNRRNIRSVSSTQTRERRKVVFVEQPGQKTSSRSSQVARTVPSMQGRPMSADDIQKAKMRAFHMQSKYGKIGSSSNGDHKRKIEDPMRPPPLPPPWRSSLPSSSKTLVGMNEENAKSAVVASTNTTSKLVDTTERKWSLDHQESSQKKYRRDQTSWKTPPEMRINSPWRVGTGEKSKEVEVQIERIRREKETFYRSNQEIPPNPKEPWDLEIDYDDTLTPEIPTEQLPDADVTESLASPIDKENTSDTSAATAAATSNCPPAAATSNGWCAPEPDMELLAVLLKNPELVFALTSGQGGSLTSTDTVRLLDMIKASETGLPGNLSGMGAKAEEKVEVTSLPSPTPGSDHIMRGWRPEVGKDRFSQSVSAAYNDAVMTSPIPSLGKLPLGGPVQPQVPSQNFSSQHVPTIVPQQVPAAYSAVLPVNQFSLPSSTLQQPESGGLGQMHILNPATISTLPSSTLQQPESGGIGQMHSLNPTTLSTLPSSTLQQPESGGLGQMHSLNPATISIGLKPMNERPPTTALHPLPGPLQPPPRPNPLLLQDPPAIQPLHTTWPLNAAGSRKQASVPAPQNVSQLTATSNHFHANQNNYNEFSRGIVGEPELEMWSPERDPMISPSCQPEWSYPEPRSDYGWNSRLDQSRFFHTGYRQHRHRRRPRRNTR